MSERALRLEPARVVGHGPALLTRSNVEPFVERNGVLLTPSMSTVTTSTCTDVPGEHDVAGEGFLIMRRSGARLPKVAPFSQVTP
jgi:hypothetical protein